MIKKSEKAIKIEKLKEELRELEPTKKFMKDPTIKKDPSYDGFVKRVEKEVKVDTMNSRDLLYLFKYVATKNGFDHKITNMNRDMSVFKKCIEAGYTKFELVRAIKFIYSSEQTFLEKSTLTPYILLTGWAKKIFKESEVTKI